MKKQRTKPDPAALGERRRASFSRDDLARWDPTLRKYKPLDLLHKAMDGRVTSLLKVKTQRMCINPFVFFRGAAPIMAADLALGEHSGITTQLCGDAHVENLGAYTGPDGRLVFDINDFDETIRGPFEWDVKRMVTSIVLAGREAEIRKSGYLDAAEAFLASYAGSMQQLGTLPVLEMARYQVHRLASVQPISKILHKAERSTPLHSLEQLTTKRKSGRIFRSEPPLLRRVTGVEAEAVLSSLAKYRESLLPERVRFFSQFKPIDVAFKVVGTGSIGLRDYCVYMEGNGSGDPLFLQIKQEVQSTYAAHLPQHAGTDSNSNQGRRVTEGQRAMQLQSDPLLGWTVLDGEDYLVRQLNDHKAAIDVANLKAASLEEYAGVCGELLARGHARSGDCRLISGFIGKGKGFSSALLSYGVAYADQTATDWKELVAQQKQH